MPFGPSLFGARPGTEDEPVDQDFQTLEDLLATLDLGQAPVRPKTGIARSIIGSIGDAISAAGRARLGIAPAPLGAFAMTNLVRQRDFERESADFKAANRDLENRIRIGDFETRKRIRLGRQEEIAKEQRRAEADEIKRGLDLETDVRKSFIDTIEQRGIDTTGIDLITTPLNELKKIIDQDDPAAGFQAVLDSLPPDMELGGIRLNKDGTMSFQIESKGGKKELPVGIIQTLIRGGEDPSSFIADPELAAAAKRAAESNKRSLLEKEADEFLEGVKKTALAGLVRIVEGREEPDPVNIGIASAIDDLTELGIRNASSEEVASYYQRQVDLADKLIRDETMTEDQAADYLTRLRRAIRVKFGEISFSASSPSEKVRTRPAP